VKPIDSGAQIAWNSGTFGTDLSVLVDSTGAGVYVDLTNWFGENWVLTVDTTESVDEQAGGATVKLARKSADRDLSPYIQSSLLNTVAGSYVPALAPNRIIKILGYVGAVGMDKNSMAPVVMFHGRIDVIDTAADDGTAIELHCRDGACDYQTQWIEAATQYSSGGGLAVDVVMQSIITDWVSQSINTSTLRVPVAPTFTVLPFVQEKSSVMEALRRLADMIGWDLRWKYSSLSAQYELTFVEPDRAGVVAPVWTFTVNNKYTVTRLSSDRTDIRNRVRVVYTDATTKLVTSVLVNDTVSEAKYGKAYMEIVEDASSEIDSSTEATAMANAILLDIKEPLADYEHNAPFHPWVELNDRISLAAVLADNDVIDTTLTLAVSQIKHSIEVDGAFKTTIALRGAPSSGFVKWLRIAAAPGVGATWNDRALGTPANVLAVQTNGGIDVTYDLPTDPNWDYSCIFVSAVNGFTPGNDSLVYKGRQTKFKVGSLVPGTTYYVKVIAFGKDGKQSTASTQIVVAANYVGPTYVNLTTEPGQLIPNGDLNAYTPPASPTTDPPDQWLVVNNVSVSAYTARPQLYGSSTTLAAVLSQDADIGSGSGSGGTGDRILRMRAGNDPVSGSHVGAGVVAKDLLPVTGGAIYELEARIKGSDAFQVIATRFIMYGVIGTEGGSFGVISQTVFDSPIEVVGAWFVRTYRFRMDVRARYVRPFVFTWYDDGAGHATPLTNAYVDYVKLRRAKPGFEINTVNAGVTGNIIGVAVLPLVFTTVQYDYGGDLTIGNATTGTYFKAPDAGQYSFEAVEHMTGTTTAALAWLSLQTSPDGTTWTTVRDGPRVSQVAGAFTGCPINCSLQLAVGTYVRLVIQKSDAGNSIISNSSVRGYWKGWRIDGGGQG
jgi:hypothetical protein